MARYDQYRKTYSGDLVVCAPTVNYIDYLNRMNYGEVGEVSKMETENTELVDLIELARKMQGQHENQKKKGGDTDDTK